MARPKASRAARRKKPVRKAASKASRKAKTARRPARRKTARKTARKAAVRRKVAKAKPARRAARRKAAPKPPAQPTKVPRLNRARRILEDDTVMATPPSSLNMDRHGSAARSGRADMDQDRRDHRSMTPEIAGGDVDVDVEDAYFTGEEAPGGDNPTPDQDVVDDIGKALGVEYADNEELKASDKVTQRDKHRWELDPASAEDYKDRD
jgi:uncharacterized protein DUF6335